MRFPGICASVVLALGVAAVAAWPPGPLAEASEVEDDESYPASRLELSGVAGEIHIRRHDGPGIRLRLRGTAEALARIEREVRDDTLHLTGKPGVTGTATSVVSIGQNTVVVSRGGRAQVTIGGVTHTVTGDGQVTITTDGTRVEHVDPPPRAEIDVPAGTPLVLDGLVGDLTVEGVGGPVDLELVGGDARLDTIAGGRLNLVGSGKVEAGAATGDLAIGVQGSGDVAIERATLERLEIELTGTGGVAVGGHAERARVRIAGVGEVRIAEVRKRPDVAISGVGQVHIGNW